MERIVITHPDGTKLPLYGRANVIRVTSGSQKKKLLGENIVEMTVRSARTMSLQIRDKITVFGEDYFLNILPEAKKLSDREYEYTVTFESVQYDLAKVVFLDEDESGLSTSASFTLRANIEEIGAIIINNLNRVYGSGKWVLYETPSQTTDVRDFSYNEDNCLAVLQRACEEYSTEFKITTYVSGGTTVYRLSIKKVGTVIQYTFKYGYNKGLYTLKRKTIDSSNIVTRLYAYGGNTNIPAGYRNYSERLRFSDDAYVEDNDAISAFGLVEGAKLFEDIYPKYSGSVTAINADDILEFTDTAMSFDLNEQDENGDDKYKIPDVSPKITFNTGALAGYTFEITSYDHETKTFKVISYEDERGQKFPSVDTSTFRIGIGDAYILSEIYPPQSFIDTAEAELLAKATEYLNGNKAPRVQYEAEIAEEYLNNKASGDSITNFFDVGDYIGIEDTEIGISRTGNASIRITEFSRDLTSKTHYNYTLALSDTVEVDIIERILSSQNELDTIVVMNNLTDVSRLKRSWRTTQELLSMVFDQDGYFDTGNIKPLSIETYMLSVGAKSQQFTLKNTVLEPNYEGNCNKFNVIGGSLVHYGLSETDSPTWQITTETIVMPSYNYAYYIYARCEKSTPTAKIYLSTDQKTVQDETYYYFLIGVLHTIDTTTNTRWISLTYGSSSVNGRFIKTGRIQSSDGSCYFDLDNNTIHGAITFTSGEETKSITDLDTAATSSYDYITNTLPGIINDIYNQLDGAIETWFGDVAPTLANTPASDWTTTTEKDNHLGDIYYDAVSGYGYRFSKVNNVYSWSQMSDSGVAEALEAASNAQDTADGKRRVFITTPYPPYDTGDLWVNGTDIKVCTNARATGSYISSDWTLASDYTNDDSLETFINGAFADLTTQVDGKIEMYYQTTNPYSSWSAADRAKHVGDMWYNTSTKVLKRFIGPNSDTWGTMEDADALAAAEAASNAQDTADGKRTVFTTTPTTPYYVGDLWTNGTDIKVCNTERLTGSYTASDWGLASNYDHTKTVIDGGIVTAGTIQLAGDSDTILAGITGNGTSGGSVRFWAGATFDSRASAPFRVTQLGEVFARYRIELQDTNNNGLAGICGQGSDGTDTGIRFWAGATFDSRASAPFRVKKNGALYCTKAELANGCTIGSWQVSNNGIFNDSGDAYMIARKSYGDGKYTEARIGTSVFPAYSGLFGCAYFLNTMSNNFGTNYGMVIDVENASYNIALAATGDVVVKGSITSYKYATVNPEANTCLVIGGAMAGDIHKIIATFTNSNSGIGLPTRTSVASKLGIDSNTPFAYVIQIITSSDSTQRGYIIGRNTIITNASGGYPMNTSYYPYRQTSDGTNDTSKFEIAKGDVVEFLLVWDLSTYRAYLLNKQN